MIHLEVLFPSVLARIEKRHLVSGCEVYSHHGITLEHVAAAAA
jgi:hypothetical protein